MSEMYYINNKYIFTGNITNITLQKLPKMSETKQTSIANLM